MVRETQPKLSKEWQKVLDHYAYVFRHVENLSAVTIRNYLSDSRQFMVWCEGCRQEEHCEPSFMLQRVTRSLLICYRSYLQTSLWLKSSSINLIFMSLKHSFAWVVREQIVQSALTSTIKFISKEVTNPRYLSEEETLVTAVDASGTLRDQTVIILLFHTRLRVRELCTLNVIGKRKKVRDIPLNIITCSIRGRYLEVLSQEESAYLFASDKTRGVLIKPVLEHIITKYIKQVHLLGLSPHELYHRFSCPMAEVISLHRLVRIMNHDSLDTTILYIREI